MGYASSQWREEHLTKQFYRWELRGRGWVVYDAPVAPEPAFYPFLGHFLPEVPVAVDDGRRATFLSSVFAKLRHSLNPEPAPPQPLALEEDPEPEPQWIDRRQLTELLVSLPPNARASRESFAQFLAHLSSCREPVAFELLGTSEVIQPQFAIHPADASLVRRQLLASFPDAAVADQDSALADLWHGSAETAVVDFGLAEEFMLGLASNGPDLLIGITAALSELQEEEVGLFQVIFQPAHHPWAENAIRAVSDREGNTYFANRPELLAAGREKFGSPLFGVTVRLVARSHDLERAWDIVREMAASLRSLTSLQGNGLLPLRNDDYPHSRHIEDILFRQSRRAGMLLNREELIALAHLPSAAVQTAKLLRERKITRSAPAELSAGTLNLGQNIYGGRSTEVFLSSEHRVRHTHIIGASGSGKSTLLLHMFRQDMERGEGLAVFDPHGDLIDAVLGCVPPHRIDDVVVLDPSDEDHVVGLNILAAHSDAERNLLASDLTAVFRRLSTSWGDQMESVLRNGILAFLESSRGGTLADLRRFLLDAAFRKEILATVSDPEIVYYWTKAFPQLTGGRSLGPLMTRLDEFLSRKPIRYMVSQQENRVDFSDILDAGRILLIRLPQGIIGRGNTALLGSLITAKLQMAAMSRQRMAASSRRDFWCYMDEFQNFITPSMAEILAGARKYRLGLILVHQELRQLETDRDVSSAVLANCGTRIVFKVGDADARALESGFSHFEARELMNLSTGEAVCRVERSDADFNLSVPASAVPNPERIAQTSAEALASSRAKYARPRAEVEAELLRKWQAETTAPAPEKKKTPVTKSLPKPVDEVAEKVEEKDTSKPVKEIVPAPPSEIKEVVVPRKPPELGRGGPTHRDCQMLIKATAEKLGCHVTLEQSVLDGQGSVDVVVQKHELRIACEISVTTRVDHEVGNILKCLAAGYLQVAVISADAKRLQEIQAALRAQMEPSRLARVGYFSLDDFLAHLRRAVEEAEPPVIEVASELPKDPPAETRHGWKVTRKVASLTPEEAEAIQERALKAITENLRKKPSA